MVDEAEVVLLARRPPATSRRPRPRSAARHSYTTPCILRLPAASVNADYLAWAQAAVSAEPSGAEVAMGFEVFGVGVPEMVLIVVVALIFLGPERLPEAARTVGGWVREIRSLTSEAAGIWQETLQVGDSIRDSVRVIRAPPRPGPRPWPRPPRPRPAWASPWRRRPCP